MRSSGCFCAVLAIGLGCGGGGEEVTPNGSEQTEQAENPAPARTVPQLRVDLAGSDQAMRIVRARVLDVPAAPPSVPSLGGNVVLVGYSATGVAATAIPFSLPKVLRVEASRDGSEPGRELPLRESSLSLFLDFPEPLSRVEVLDRSGAVVVSMTDAEFEAAPVQPKQQRFEPQLRQELQRDFPRIDFLGPDEDVGIALDNFTNPVELSELTAKMAENIRKGLLRMPEAAFFAVHTVAVGRFDGGSAGITYGSTVLLNTTVADVANEASQVLVHEATHAYEFLVDGGLQVDVLNAVDWRDDVKQAVQQTVEDFRLQAGLSSVWGELHADAVKEGLGSPYLGDDWRTLSNLDDNVSALAAAPLGFASAMGARNGSEDIAEYVGWLVVPEARNGNPVCDRVKNAGSPFPIESALPYIKVKLLEGLQLLSPAQVRACVGEPAIEGPPGIHLGSNALTEDIQGGFLTLEGERFLGVLASAPPYQMLIRVRASEDQPRGVYRLDDIGYFGIERATNGVLLGHDTSNFEARTSARGLVLVSEYSPQRLAGAVFFLQLRNAGGLITGSYPFGTFRVDR